MLFAVYTLLGVAVSGNIATVAAGPRERESLIDLLQAHSLQSTAPSILVGQLAAEVNGQDNYLRCAKHLGKAPAIYHWEARWDYGGIGFDEYVRRSIKAAEKGAIITIGWVDKHPPKAGTTLEDCDKTNPARDPEAYSIFWDEWVEELAGYLAALSRHNIPVLLRPFHEPENRAWISKGKRAFRNVWQQLHEDLVHRRQLHNVLFVLGLDSTRDPDYLPEAAFVDVVGTSEYVDPPYEEEDFMHLRWLRELHVYRGKPVAICETGTLKNGGSRSRAVDYLDAVQKYAPFVCYISWWHESVDNSYQWALHRAEQAEQFIVDSRVVTLETLNKDNSHRRLR